MPNTYWIVCPKVTSKTPKIATFRNWLLAEAAEDARRLEALASATVDDIAKEQAAT
jgi:LysR family transcriptional regulator, glycine cleavage system transcriptional activator